MIKTHAVQFKISCSAAMRKKTSVLQASILLLSVSVSFAGIESAGGKATLTLPNSWNVSSRAPNSLIAENSTGSVTLIVSSQPASEEKTIGVADYDALNTLLTPILYTLELETIKNWIGGNLPVLNIAAPALRYGPTANYKFYGAYLVNNYTVTDYSITDQVTVFHQILLDGETVYLLKLIMGSSTTSTESNQAIGVVDSLTSTTISSPLTDTDGDGIDNFTEVIFYGSNPLLKDTNSDGIDDDVIVGLGGSPSTDYGPLFDFIEKNPSTFGLYNSTSIQDLRIGGVMLEKSMNGNFDFTYKIEESSDLLNWTVQSTPAIEIAPNPGKHFLRVGIGQ